MQFAVCLSFTDQRPEVDPLTGEVATDVRSSGLSAADSAALELALQVAAAWGAEVVAVTVGPREAEAVLRDALAVGASRAVRVALPVARSAAQVAAALRPVVGDAALVWCGDQGLDAGSGAVPAFLAAMLGVEAALGLVDVTAPAANGADVGSELTVLRRLDGGRREQLVVGTPAVLSVEGGVARLRRASLPAVLRAGQATIEIVASTGAVASPHVRIGLPTPYRPAPRVVPAPSGDTALDRVRALTGASGASGGTTRSAAARVASPAEAADAILEALAAWGYELPERAPR